MNLFSSLGRLSLLPSTLHRCVSSQSNRSTDLDKAKAQLDSSAVELDNETKLKLYALYKQSTKGICSTSKPGLTDFVARAKWTAWSALGQMNEQEAQKQYVDTVAQLLADSPKGKCRDER